MFILPAQACPNKHKHLYIQLQCMGCQLPRSKRLARLLCMKRCCKVFGRYCIPTEQLIYTCFTKPRVNDWIGHMGCPAAWVCLVTNYRYCCGCVPAGATWSCCSVWRSCAATCPAWRGRPCLVAAARWSPVPPSSSSAVPTSTCLWYSLHFSMVCISSVCVVWLGGGVLNAVGSLFLILLCL